MDFLEVTQAKIIENITRVNLFIQKALGVLKTNEFPIKVNILNNLPVEKTSNITYIVVTILANRGFLKITVIAKDNELINNTGGKNLATNIKIDIGDSKQAIY